jgi:REP element-mobilizing transposase RayT
VRDFEVRRKPTRLRNYDYRTPALYHVVNCTHQNVCRFGVVRESAMHCNVIGDMIEEIWESIPAAFSTVSLDTSILMPNHHHGIIFIEPQTGDLLGPSLGDIMKWFKTVTTVRYSRGVGELGWPRYDRHLWHRNYYDHIIRDDRDLDRIRDYIDSNPSSWNTDRFYAEPGSTWS